MTFEKAISGEQWSKKQVAGLGSEEMVRMWRRKMGALLRGFWQRSGERKVHSKEVGSNVKGRWVTCPLGKLELISNHREMDLLPSVWSWNCFPLEKEKTLEYVFLYFMYLGYFSPPETIDYTYITTNVHEWSIMFSTVWLAHSRYSTNIFWQLTCLYHIYIGTPVLNEMLYLTVLIINLR